ncbi:MAG: alpha/beta hydrolase [Chloroflexi bacterium]|nr:alpha/beta hydrolase [Chloroflexota bacterium]
MKEFLTPLWIVTAISLSISSYGQIPRRWTIDAPAGRVDFDRNVYRSGTASAHLTGADSDESAAIRQKFKADAYAGDRIRVTAHVKSQDVEKQAWLFVWTDAGSGDWMQDRAIRGSGDWKKHELVIDIPLGSIAIHIGAAIAGKGEIWVDDWTIERVDKTVPTTGGRNEDRLRLAVSQELDHPTNLGFESPMMRFETHTYKTIGSLEIKADVYRNDDKVARPVVVLMHGGALISGGREDAEWPVSGLFYRIVEAGYIAVSIDYRLAPETLLPEIIRDVEDAFRWVREKGPVLLNADAEKIAAWGLSAGGYLALVSGHRTEPRPKAIVSLFGYGDLIGDWYSQPNNAPRYTRKILAEAEARSLVAGAPVSNDRQRMASGNAFYFYCRRKGIWPNEVTGWNPQAQAPKFYPYMPLRNVSSTYPPTLLIHGTADTDVPYEQSVLMSKELRRHGVPHRLITITNGEHGFTGGDPEEIAAAYDAAFAFLDEYLNPSLSPN